MSSEVQYDFGFGDRFAHTVVPFRKLSSVKALPGIYAWFLRAVDGSFAEWQKINSVYSSRELRVNAVGSLGEVYSGSLEKVPFEAQEEEFLSGMTDSIAAFTTPLYIGISVNVLRRLTEHQRSFDSSFHGPPIGGLMGEGRVDSDTEEESNVFGVRLATSLREAGITHTSNIFLKVVYLPEAEKRNLLCVEALLNRTFHPPLGRK